MLAKADDRGVDWVTFLPMALAAVRKVPNRDTGFSPYELVCGRKMNFIQDEECLFFHSSGQNCTQDKDLKLI